jgi:hypothetical protein
MYTCVCVYAYLFIAYSCVLTDLVAKRSNLGGPTAFLTCTCGHRDRERSYRQRRERGKLDGLSCILLCTHAHSEVIDEERNVESLTAFGTYFCMHTHWQVVDKAGNIVCKSNGAAVQVLVGDVSIPPSGAIKDCWAKYVDKQKVSSHVWIYIYIYIYMYIVGHARIAYLCCSILLGQM